MFRFFRQMEPLPGRRRSDLLSAKCVATQPKMNAVRKDSDTMKV